MDTILAQLDTPINNAIQAALSGLYSSKAVSSSPIETSFTSVVSQAPAITVQTSGTFSSAEGSEDNIEGQYNAFSTSEGDSSSFTSNTQAVSDDSASFFSSSLQSSQDSNSFFSSNSFQGSSSSGSLEDSYVPLTTFTDSTSGSGSGFNSGSSSSSSSTDSSSTDSSSSSSSSSTDSSSLVSQVVGELGPQIDEAVRAALAALKTPPPPLQQWRPQSQHQLP